MPRFNVSTSLLFCKAMSGISFIIVKCYLKGYYHHSRYLVEKRNRLTCRNSEHK